MKNIKYLLLMSSSILFFTSDVSQASVCHITNFDCSGNGGGGFNDKNYGLDTEQICLGKGYIFTSCPVGKNAKYFCPDDSKYFKSCSCPSEFQYSSSSCNSSYPNSVLGSEQCSSDGITYANSCVCDTVKYPYTTSNCTGNESLSGTICKSSNGITYGSGCICTPTSGKCSGYSLNSNSCTGEYSIGESCHDGCNTKWRCKDLCQNKGTLTSCPNGYVCTLEACSSKFYITGCAVNYKNYCTVPVMDCTTLGYVRTAAYCTGAALKCPYDNTKMACAEEGCEIGSIYYSDKSCSKTVTAGKTAIGIVFDTNKRLAVALDQNSSMLQGSPGGKYEDVTALPNCEDGSTIWSCNPNGKDNTSKIVAQYGNSTNYAAGYCADYVTSGTSKGEWYLPSMAELKSIYNAKTYVNASLQLLGKSALAYGYYWSSTEYNNINSWILFMDNGNGNYYYKVNNYFVRAVVAF